MKIGSMSQPRSHEHTPVIRRPSPDFQEKRVQLVGRLEAAQLAKVPFLRRQANHQEAWADILSSGVRSMPGAGGSL